MNWQYARHCIIESPDNASKTNDNQSTVDKCREKYLAQLCCEIAFKNVAHRMELRIIRVSYEVCNAKQLAQITTCRGRHQLHLHKTPGRIILRHIETKSAK